VKYLGHILSKDGIATDPAKTAVIVNWPQPQNVKQMKSFLGVCSYYRRYIFNYYICSAPVTELTAKDVPFLWSERQEHAFADLKTALTNPPILCYLDINRPFYVQMDASLEGIGFLLGQIDQNGNKHVVAYGGRGLRSCIRKLPIMQLECLAMLTAIKENHVYLAGQPFNVYTDHISLKYLQSLKVTANNHLARWSLALQQYTLCLKKIHVTTSSTIT